MPRMPFSGVRISWLMLARKSLLARLALSACTRATTSAASRRLISAVMWLNASPSAAISSRPSTEIWADSPRSNRSAASLSREIGRVTSRARAAAPSAAARKPTPANASSRASSVP